MTEQIRVNDRIHLSEIRPTDKAAFVEHLDDKDIYDCTLGIPYPYSAVDAEHFIEKTVKATAEHGHPVHFAIREETTQLIGCCGFSGLTCGHCAEIGYWLAKPLWGHGIMTDVVRAASTFAIEEWRLVRITAHVFDVNTASARVLEKNGFELEGLLRKHETRDGKFIDARMYALIR